MPLTPGVEMPALALETGRQHMYTTAPILPAIVAGARGGEVGLEPVVIGAADAAQEAFVREAQLTTSDAPPPPPPPPSTSSSGARAFSGGIGAAIDGAVAGVKFAERRCCLCDCGPVQTSKRTRVVSLHPLVPVKDSGAPVYLCAECERKVVEARASAAEQRCLLGRVEEHVSEEVCAVCASGTPDLPLDLVCCSAKHCPRCFCPACVEIVVTTSTARRAIQYDAEWLCPVCRVGSAALLAAKERDAIAAIRAGLPIAPEDAE
jgi:hypothetical protein